MTARAAGPDDAPQADSGATPAADPHGADGPGADGPRGRWGRLFPWVTIAVSLLLVAWLFSRFTGWALLTRVELRWLGPALLLSLLLNLVLAPLRFLVVVGWFGWRREPWALVRMWIGWIPGTTVLPFHSGALALALSLQRQQGQPSYGAALAIVAYDKFVSLVGLCCLVSLGQIWLPVEHPLSHPLLAGLGPFALLLYLTDGVWLRLLARSVPRFVGALPAREASPGRRLIALALAVVVQGSDVITVYLLVRGMGLALPPGSVLGVIPVVALLSLIPITVNGFGAREALTVLLLGTWLSFDQGVAIGLLVDLLEYLVPALIGFVFFWSAMATMRRRSGV